MHVVGKYNIIPFYNGVERFMCVVVLMPCREGAKEFYDIVAAWTKFWSVQNCNNYMWCSLVTLMNVCRRSGEGGYECQYACRRSAEILCMALWTTMCLSLHDFQLQMLHSHLMLPLSAPKTTSDMVTLHLFVQDKNCMPHALIDGVWDPTCLQCVGAPIALLRSLNIKTIGWSQESLGRI